MRKIKMIDSMEMNKDVDMAVFRRRSIAAIVALISGLVMLSWFNDWKAFLVLRDDWVPMQFVTAWGLFICAVSVLLKTEEKKRFMKGLVFATALYTVMSYGREISFVPAFEVGAGVMNYPSLITILCFLCFGVVGWFWELRQFYGWMILVTTAMVFVGYVLGVDWMYGKIDGISEGMSIHAAVAFIHLGYYLVDNKMIEERGEEINE